MCAAAKIAEMQLAAQQPPPQAAATQPEPTQANGTDDSEDITMDSSDKEDSKEEVTLSWQALLFPLCSRVLYLCLWWL